jgi:hypothetical protein
MENSSDEMLDANARRPHHTEIAFPNSQENTQDMRSMLHNSQ